MFVVERFLLVEGTRNLNARILLTVPSVFLLLSHVSHTDLLPTYMYLPLPFSFHPLSLFPPLCLFFLNPLLLFFLHSSSPLAGSDYSPLIDYEFTMTQGQTFALISIPIISDDAIELRESFLASLSLVSPLQITVAPDVASITIEDDSEFCEGFMS